MIRRHTTLIVADDAVILISIIATTAKDKDSEAVGCCAAHLILSTDIEPVSLLVHKLYRIRGAYRSVPLVADVLAASLNGVGSIARLLIINDIAHLAFIVLWLVDDVGRSVFGYRNIGHDDCAEGLFTYGAADAGPAVSVLLRVRLYDGNGRAFCMYILVDSTATIEADVPMSVFVALPLCADICVSTIGIVVAFLEALLVGVAPMFHELAALYAKFVFAAHRLCVGQATDGAELAFIATVTAFEAVTALIADEVVAVVVERAIVRAIVVFAMITLGTTLAFAAVLAELIGVEAVATVCAKVLFPFITFRT